MKTVAIMLLLVSAACAQTLESTQPDPTIRSLPGDSEDVSRIKDAPAPFGATPTVHQVNWQRLEFYAFIHFGLNTFTGREWGFGDEDPAIFSPEKFDADAIVNTFKDAGMTGMIYTAKHHDGFCAWPTKSTKHNITKAAWKNGKGDVVMEFAKACQKAGINFGTYLSPWDRNHSEYGREGYLKAYYTQIRELLTNYGPVFEIWFDGANGGDGYYGGARERRNIGDASKYYDFEKIVENIRKMQPQCIVWGAGHFGDARWGGSEKGFVNYPHWHTLDTKRPGDGGTGVEHGDRWVPAEGDTTINHAGWFWHPGQASRVKSSEELMNVWFDCVGRGANLILNVAANRDGRLDPADVKPLMEFKKLREQLYAKDFARGAKGNASQVRNNNAQAFGPQNLFDGDIDSYWAVNDAIRTPSVEIQLAGESSFNVVRVREQIRLGQRVEGWAVDAWLNGNWEEVLQGSTIGNQAMLRLDRQVTTDRVRLRITKSPACPVISEFSLLLEPRTLAVPQIKRDKDGQVTLSAKGFDIYYTVDGSEPGPASTLYTKPFDLPGGGTVTAVASRGDEISETATVRFDVAKAQWKIHAVSSENPSSGEGADKAIDGDPATLWHSKWSGGEDPMPHSITIDLGEALDLKGFTYLPRSGGVKGGLLDQYKVEVSRNGKKWMTASEGRFDNIENDPTQRAIRFEKSASGVRYLRFTGLHSIENKPHSSAAEIGVITR